MKLRNMIYVTATLAVLVSGFFLPQVLSQIQDRGQINQTSRYEIDSIQFEVSVPVVEKLGIISQTTAYLPLENGKLLDKNTAHEAALNAVRELMSPYGLLANSLSTYTKHTETPYLAVAAEEHSPFVIWECVLTAEDQSSMMLTIDESTKKIVSLTIQAGIREEENTIIYDPSFAPTQELVYAWNDALAAYYGLSRGTPDIDIYDTSIFSLLSFSGDAGSVSQLSFVLQPYYITFNRKITNPYVSVTDMTF